MKNFEIPDELLKPPKIGEIVEGKIIGVGRSAIYLDLAPFGTGVIYGKEFYEGKDILKKVDVGDTLAGKVINLDNENGLVELSVAQAKRELSWKKLTEEKEKDQSMKVKILGANKGGLLTKVSGIPAFLPVSQLSSKHYPRVEQGNQRKILEKLRKFIGQELEVKILNLSPKEEKLILSEKATKTDKIKEALKNYKVGDVVKGEITAVLDFGAFIKFSPTAKPPTSKEEEEAKEEIEGLIHISELDWKLIEDPSEVVRVGDKVKAEIIDISNGKVSLSLKALKENPWNKFAQKHQKGEIISGQVSKFNHFGAFIRVTDKIQGLCHVSQFDSQEKMKETLEIGEKYDFEILSIEPGEYRLTLKFKK